MPAPEIAQSPRGLTAKPLTRKWVGWTRPTRYKSWLADGLTDTISGPFANRRVSAITELSNSSKLLAISEREPVGDGDPNKCYVWKTDLKDMREGDFAAVTTNPWIDLSDLPRINEPEGGPSNDDYCVATINGEFAYRGKHLATPFGTPTTGSATIYDPIIFPDASLSIFETAWMHLGDEHNEKQLHRVDLNFKKNSFGHLWLYVQNDSEQVKGQYKGELKEHVKVFANLRGRRFRIKTFIMTHHNYPWNLREMSTGFLQGKSF